MAIRRDFESVGLFPNERLYILAGVGRPKQFDRENVLAKALDLFWQRGYRNVTARELATEMGINVATVYAEFGDKEHLFRESIARYESEYVPGYIGSLEHAEANIGTIAEVLGAFAEFAESGNAPGCLITNSAIEQAPDPEQSQAALLRYVERLRSAYANALHDPANPFEDDRREDLAHALAATTLGLFVLIRAKAPATIVRRVVDVAIASASALVHDSPVRWAADQPTPTTDPAPCWDRATTQKDQNP